MPENIHIPSGKYDWLHANYERSTLYDPEINNVERCLVIMIHGFPNSHKLAHNDLFGGLSSLLSKDGFDILSFDFRGCGQSDGKKQDFNFESARQDLRAVYEWADNAGYDSVALAAEGLGASLALLETPGNTKALILLWPMLDPKNSWLKKHLQKLNDPEFKDKKNIKIDNDLISKSFLQDIQTCELKGFINVLTLPVLVQHGIEDQLIPIEQLDLLRNHAKASERIEITSYESGEHGLLKPNERNTMLYHIRQFLHKYA